jgi:hypothetical protein
VWHSRFQSEAEKLESSLEAARAELRRSSEESARLLEAQCRAFELHQTAFARLIRLKKVREKVRSKEFRLVEQGLYKLEAEEAKMDSV